MMRGDELAALRTEVGWNHDQLAQALHVRGVTAFTVRLWENASIPLHFERHVRQTFADRAGQPKQSK